MKTHVLWWMARVALAICLSAGSSSVHAAEGQGDQGALEKRIRALEESLDFLGQKILKQIDDVYWTQQIESIAWVNKVRYVGAPPRVVPNPTAQGAGNPLLLRAYTFIPKAAKSAGGGRLPLLVLVHGGVHSDFKTSDELNIVRELLAEGYAIIAPEFRGSTGYGRELWEQIDYGGLENDDVYQAKQWMLEHHADVIDTNRVGILGWSHGGMITLMNVFEHPKDYAVAYAGVPVSDLVARMGYKNEAYRKLFSAPYHIGKTAEEDVQEYRRRSPAWHAHKLESPLLIHTTTNDEDVNVLEVEHLIKSLQAAGKNFEHRIYTNAPGGHQFNRLDTKLAQESRAEIYRFLARYLRPPGRGAQGH